MASKLQKEGDTLFSEGKYLKAAACYMKCAKKEPENAEVRCNLSYALLKEYKFHKALEAADAAVAIDGTLERAHFRKGLAHAALEEWEPSIMALLEAQKRQVSSTNKEVSDMIAMAKWQCKRVATEAGKAVPEIAKDAVKPEEPEKPAKSEKVEPHGPLKEEESREDKLKKLAAVKSALHDRRTKKHIKEERIKASAQAIADKELVTKDLIAKGKLALEADRAVGARASELTTDTVLEEKKKGMQDGDKLAYDAARVARFAAAELADLVKGGDRQSYKEPVAVVLPGVAREGWGDEGQGLSLWNAFSTPEQHLQMCKFTGKFVADAGAHAALFICPREKVQHPDLWKQNAQAEGCPKGPGFLVQLQAKERADCAAWFVEVAKEGAAGTVVKLADVEAWRIMPNVFDPAAIAGSGKSKKQVKAEGKKNASKAARKAMSQVNSVA